MYELIEEAEMMENLGIILPGGIQMLLAKKNTLFNDIMKVQNMIYTYNSFISIMSDLEVSKDCTTFCLFSINFVVKILQNVISFSMHENRLGRYAVLIPK